MWSMSAGSIATAWQNGTGCPRIKAILRLSPADKRVNKGMGPNVGKPALAHRNVLHIIVAVAIDVEIIGVHTGERGLLPAVQHDLRRAADDRPPLHPHDILRRKGAQARTGGEQSDLDRFGEPRLRLLT